jgi:hypothetical protein
MKKGFYIIVIIVFFVGITVYLNSCRQPNPPKAIVTIVDEKGEAVEDAWVIIKSFNADDEQTVIYLEDRTSYVADSQKTNYEGKVHYDFKYKAIYNVEAIKTFRQAPYRKTGEGVLMLEEDKNLEITVMIK